MLNQDFRSADEVIVPPDAEFGWTDGKVSQAEAYAREQAGLDRLANDMPVAIRGSEPAKPMPAMQAKWDEFQASKGRGPGSCDLSLLDEFVFGMVLAWLPQIIGSCVVSNTFRGWVMRMLYQIALLGMPMEYLGRSEFGPKNLAFYGPFTYGSARRRGNMRGGDGLYGDVMAESLLKDGVLSCANPALMELLKRNGVASEKDFPEPQNKAFYRAWGDWRYLDDFKQYADYSLQECPAVKSADDVIARAKVGMPSFFCSMIAIHKTGTHKDGFAIHKRNPRDAWAHNMEFLGFFYASDGDLFFRFSNESWGITNIYNVPYDEVVDWFRNRQPTSFAIGTINGPKSAPPTIG
jgi:hypothetical protein